MVCNERMYFISKCVQQLADRLAAGADIAHVPSQTAVLGEPAAAGGTLEPLLAGVCDDVDLILGLEGKGLPAELANESAALENDNAFITRGLVRVPITDHQISQIKYKIKPC